VDIFEVKPADLLNAWRDAVRASELAERMAAAAAEATEAADHRALDTAELAELAQQAAVAAQRAADRATATAIAAAALADRMHNESKPAAYQTVEATAAAEARARDAYHDGHSESLDESTTSN
jgi:hypothetical protein